LQSPGRGGNLQPAPSEMLTSEVVACCGGAAVEGAESPRSLSVTRVAALSGRRITSPLLRNSQRLSAGDGGREEVRVVRRTRR
jgi:hypothetical protein